jgi:hypothetical protein
VVFSPDYLAEPLTPNPLPTKDGGVLRTIDDARAFMLDCKRHHLRLLAGPPVLLADFVLLAIMRSLVGQNAKNSH